MPVKKKSKLSESKVVTLSGCLSLRCAGAIRAELLDALDAAQTVKLAFGDVEEVDLSLVQLICAAHRSALQRDRTIIMPDSLPDQMAQVVTDAGLEGHIGCSSEGRDRCLLLGRPD